MIEHGRQVNRRGAFAETCLAVERIHSAGLSVGCNLFVTSDNLPQLDELIATLRRLPIDAAAWWGVASFLPTPRSRRNERVRPTLTDLLPVADRVLEVTCQLNRGWWANLEAQTEAAYVRRALGGEWLDPPKRRDGKLALVCRPSLDVYSGLAGLHRKRHGNLRTDSVKTVLSGALAHGRRPDDVLWFDVDLLPTPSELAERHGNAAGLCIHPAAESVRYLWLDRAKRTGPADLT